MKLWLENANESAYYNQTYQQWKAGFNNVFWSDSRGYYYDWVDIEGHIHSYFYV